MQQIVLPALTEPWAKLNALFAFMINSTCLAKKGSLVMRNRAKCKLCGDLLESFHLSDWVECKCQEISICGGLVKAECAARDWKNFIRIDDSGKEIVPKIIDKDQIESIEDVPVSDDRSPKRVAFDCIKDMIELRERLPEQALMRPVTETDFLCLLYALQSLLTSENT